MGVDTNGKHSGKVVVGVFPIPHFLHKYLDKCHDQYEIHFIEPDPTFANVECDILKWVAYCRKHCIKIVISLDHEYMIWQSILNELIGAVAESNSPSLAAMLFAMNKYHTRQIDDPSFWSCPIDPRDPEAAFAAVAGRYPCIVKASNLNLARGVWTVKSDEALAQLVTGDSEIAREAESFRDIALRFLPKDALLFPSFMAEMRLDLLDPKLKQFTVDCLCTSDGRFRPHVVREEMYFSNYQKLGYLVPPPSLGRSEMLRLVEFTKYIGDQIAERGFVNQFFNMEVWMLPEGEFRLVEINVLPNPHFVGMTAHLTGHNYIRQILDLHARKLAPPTDLIDHLLAGDTGMTCLQSEMSCVTPGRVGDLFDMTALRQLPADNHCMMWVNDDEKVFDKAHMSTAGWAVAEVFLQGTSLQDVLQKDEALRKAIYKVNRPQGYPEVPTSGEMQRCKKAARIDDDVMEIVSSKLGS